MRFLIIAAIMLASISDVHAVTCKQVRDAVKLYGSGAVIYWARINGYSEERIARLAKVCLK